MTILRPDTEPGIRPTIALAPREELPARPVIGLIDNGKAGAKQILQLLAAELSERLDRELDVVLHSKPAPSAALPGETAAAIARRCDVVIAGIGDCGACSACSVHDAIMVEDAGTPATVLITEPFQAIVASNAAKLGAPGYHTLTVPHPVWGKGADELRSLARQVVDAAIAHLTEEAESAARSPAARVAVPLPPLAVRSDDLDDVFDSFDARGWTDGLPIVPPTADRVRAMLDVVSADDPELLIGFLPTRGVGVSLEKAAINAVMAGCRPEYFPVVVAALEAMFDTDYNLHASLSSTGGSAICAIVSGPVAAEIGMNARHNVLGQGNRANATIGRALRLVAVNVLGAHPGEADASSFGHPGKYTFCFAEDPPPHPWEPLRVQLGYGLDDTTVTVVSALAPHRITQPLTNSAERVLRTVAAEIRSPAQFYKGAGKQGVVMLGPEHAGFCVADGWKQSEVREFLVKESRIDAAELARSGVHVDEIEGLVPHTPGTFSGIRSPDDVLLVTAGGEGAGFSVWISSHSWVAPTVPPRRASRRVRPAGEALPECGPDGCIVPWAAS